ncbi:hypothetical protein FQN50_002893 [Emmonsiellopsis sp. PD_5]|nr:hypothetical protein FQN50_002893 [Emmonsiellopsis sp. PD_5]
MAQHPGFGVFSKLPYELRQQIWLELLPVCQDPGSLSNETSAKETSTTETPAKETPAKETPAKETPAKEAPPKADLRVLRTSKTLYNEISTLLYSKTCLHFDLSPNALECPTLWGTVSFTRRYAGRKNDIVRAVWNLESNVLDRDHRLDNFPFHKIDAIEVSISAPDPEKPERFILQWRNVVRTVELLKNASSFPPLTIQLRKDNGHDWYDTKGINHGLCEKYENRNYEVLVLPFYTPRNIKSIRVEPHSEELRNQMDWETFDWASHTISKRTGDPTTHFDLAAERELYIEVIGDYYWIDGILRWDFYLTDENVDLLRREWFSQTFRSIGEREFPEAKPSRLIPRPGRSLSFRNKRLPR